MSEMFKNYPQPEDYVPNNRPKHCKCSRITLMTGETAEHTFDIPFNVESDCLDYSVIYKLGLEDIIIKEKDELEVSISEDNKFSTITCHLSSEETSLYRNTLLSANVQLKFYMRDASVAFSDIYKIYVTTSLETGDEPHPTPGILVGLGYTED